MYCGSVCACHPPTLFLSLFFFFCSFPYFSFALSHTCSHMTHQVSSFPSSSPSFSHLPSHSLSTKHTYMLFLFNRLSISLCSFFFSSVPTQHIFIQLLSIKNGLDFTFTVCLQRENRRGRMRRNKKRGGYKKPREMDEEENRVVEIERKGW